MPAKRGRPGATASLALSPWREVARPHADIIQGRFELAVFAANLYEVYREKSKPDYQDPERFFERTFMTKGLAEMVTGVLLRLSGKPGGESVVDLITSFGGGKTHALIALYHIANSGPASQKWPGVSEAAKLAGLEVPPKADTAVLSGEDISPVKGTGDAGEPVRHTLWGELAWQIGKEAGYKVLQAEDESRVAPAVDEIVKVLPKNKPVLILADEILQYLSRARGARVVDTTLASQTFDFIKALTEAVDRTPRACLVATLPASVTIEMNKEDEEDYKRLSHIVRRKERVRRLAEGDEIYEIVRRRLFQDVGNEDARRNVINSYHDYYRDHEGAFPQAVLSPEYLRKMERSYPFHPELLDVLNERWSSIPNFQRTRGVLRMLALLIGDLYRTSGDPLIQPSSARLSNRDFRAEVLGQIDQRQFDAVIESDIAGTGARAAKLDEEGNETYQREHLAEKVATATFLYSFGGTTGVSAATAQQLRLATLRPGLEPAFIIDVLDQMKRKLYYLDADGGQFRFTVQPNLNAIRVDLETQLEPPKVEEFVREEVKRQVRGDRFHAVLFPLEPRDVPDQASLSLVVMSPNQTWGKSSKRSTEGAIQSILAGGTTHRYNRNAVVFLVADENHRLFVEGRTKLALDAILRLYQGKLSTGQQRELDSMLRDGKAAMQQAVWSAYRYALTPEEGGSYKEADLGRPLQREGRSLQDEVWERLVQAERIAPSLGASQLSSDAFGLWPKGTEALSLRNVREAFAQYTYLPMIPDASVLRRCISDGVERGIFGLGFGEGTEREFDAIRYAEPISPEVVDFSGTAWLLRPELARSLVAAPSAPASQQGAGGPAETGSQVTIKVTPEAKTGPLGNYKTVVVEGELDWKKWADFYDGVIMPLVKAGAIVRVHVRTDGSSDSGIPRNVVEIGLRENISQRGLDVRVLSEAEQQKGDS